MKASRPLIDPRIYQEEHLLDAMHKNPHHVMFIYGVGGGKTPTSLILVKLWLAQGIVTHAIAVTTQRATAQQFTQYSDREFRLPKSFSEIEGAQAGKIQSFAPHWKTSGGYATGNDLLGYVATGNPERALLVANYQVFLAHADAIDSCLREGKRMVVVVDEGHHVHDVGDLEIDDIAYEEHNLKVSHAIGKLRKHYRAGEFRTVKLTGTPYRSDNRSVTDTADLTFEKRLVNLMLDGFAPKQVVTQYVPIDGDYQVAARQIAEQWMADGCPSALLRVKPRSSEVNRATVAALKKAFGALKRQPHLYDVTLEDGDDALEEALKKSERGELEPHAVFITLQRMVEGVDVPTLTHAYFWGVPRSMLVIEQTLGRILRLRIDVNGKPIRGCAPEWVHKSKAVFFFGNASDWEPDEGELMYSRMLLRAFVFLSSFQHPPWLIRQMLGIEDGLPSHKAATNHVAVDQYELTLAKEMLIIFQGVWSRRVNVALSYEIARRPKLFQTSFVEWYRRTGVHLRVNPKGKGKRGRKADPILSDEILMHALHHQRLLQLTDQGQQLASKRDRTPEEDSLLRKIFNEQTQDFHEQYFKDGFITVDGTAPDTVANEFKTRVMNAIENVAETPVDLLPRCEQFYELNKKTWPTNKDLEPEPIKPVPFNYYLPMLRQHGYDSLAQFICLTREDPLLQISLAWDYARELRQQKLQIKELPGSLKTWGKVNGNAVAELYTDLIVFCATKLDWKGVDMAVEMDEDQARTEAEKVLTTLQWIRRNCPSDAKLEPVRKAYARGSFAGVIKWVRSKDRLAQQMEAQA